MSSAVTSVERPALQDTPAEDYAHIQESSTHYCGAILDIVRDDIELDGQLLRREYMTHDDAVAVMPIREGAGGEEVLLIRQYRHPIRRIMWEIPAGLLDIEGEGAEAAARRELYEEADLVGGELTQLVQLYATPGCSTELYTIYAARGCEQATEPFERTEEEAAIERFWLPFDEVLRAVQSGALRSPTLVTAVLAYASME
ncbi:MAG: NUDIX hydrolase [Actinomycetaceae bacterium]|nr:NUDIX hydrolase [Actinomycetaceae bacterium]